MRKSTLLELAGKKGLDLSKIRDNFGKDLDRCFQTFTAVHKCCDSLAVIRRITEEMIEDFSKENVAYLEIRTVFMRPLYGLVVAQGVSGRRDQDG